MQKEGMAANIEQLERRAKHIEQELHKRADGEASCAELAAVLQECDIQTRRPANC
jgi:hypothetical protein